MDCIYSYSYCNISYVHELHVLVILVRTFVLITRSSSDNATNNVFDIKFEWHLHKVQMSDKSRIKGYHYQNMLFIWLWDVQYTIWSSAYKYI